MSKAIFTSGQIVKDQLAELAANQVKLIFACRPDHEEPNQPTAAEIAAAAKAHGMELVHIPMVGMNVDEAQVAKAKAAFDACDGAVLGYCKSGRRAEFLFNQIGAGHE